MPSNNEDQRLFNGNTAVGQRSEGSTSIPNYNSQLHIGSLYGHTGTGNNATRFNGWIAEVVLYNQSLGSAQHIIVNNYLAAKYGLSMAEFDIYTMDDPANGDYDHEVAGIGQVAAGNDNQVARGTGIVEIGGATDLDNGEFMLWGHDNADLNDWWSNVDHPAGIIGRMARSWRVSEVDLSRAPVDVGAVDIILHMAGLLPVAANHLYLLVDSNNDGSFADETPIGNAMDLGGERALFAGITALTHGARFTIGYTSTPLPVKLIAFNAINSMATVDLTWSTASELDNAYFTIERTQDLAQWQPVSTVPSQGNSQQLQTYHTADLDPVLGLSYYRLRQTDLDGTSTVSGLRTIDRRSLEGEMILIPNPGSGTVRLQGASTAWFDVLDVTGRMVFSGPVAQGIDVSAWPAGRYLVRAGDQRPAVLVVQH